MAFAMRASLATLARPAPAASLQARRRTATPRTGFVVRAAVTTEEMIGEDARLKVKVTVTKDMLDTSYDHVVNEIQKTMNVPGFRKGKGKKASPKLLLQSYGMKNFKAAVMEDVLHRTIPDVMSGVSDRCLDESEKIETEMDDLLAFLDGPDGKPTRDLEYTMGFDVVPELTWKKDYKSIVVEVDSAGNNLTIEMEANKAFRQLVKDKKGVMRVVADRGLEAGDISVLAISGCRVNDDGSDGEDIDGVNNPNFRLDTADGEDFLPGFVDNITGMKITEAKQFNISFPEDWPVPELAGTTAKFNVTLKELFKLSTPDLTDDLAKDLWEGATTMDEVLAGVKKEVSESIAGQTSQRVTNAITDQLSEMVECTVPKSLLDQQGRQNYSVKVMELLSSGGISKEVLNTLMSEELVQNFIQKEKEDIERVVRLTMAVNDIQKRENITVTDEEVEKEAAISRAEFDKLEQEYDEDRVKEQAKELLEGSKTLDWLKANCSVTINEPSA
jgi:trigger factor